MESAARKKRTLAERRESDKLRQRRFRAKKREEARLLQVITGAVVTEKKERVYTGPRKTAEEIRETNRIRQQRFRAKKRGVDDPIEPETVKEEEPTVEAVSETENPVDVIQRFLLQAASDEKDRQTEIRREKDRIRKRRERQRKRERQAGLETKTASEERQCSEDPEDDDTTTTTQFMSQLEQMGLLAGLLADSSTPSSSTSNTSSEEVKKPWNRFSSADERRERERMRKRMYRARQKFISTGRLEMQWDPTPIKRASNEDDSEVSEDEDKLGVVNKRSRERNKSNESNESDEPRQDSDLTNLPSELYTELLATISKYDLSTLIGQNNQNDE